MNLENVNKAIKDSGMKKYVIAERLGITEVSLRNKLRGKTEFTAKEIVALQKTLHLTTEERERLFFT